MLDTILLTCEAVFHSRYIWRFVRYCCIISICYFTWSIISSTPTTSEKLITALLRESSLNQQETCHNYFSRLGSISKEWKLHEFSRPGKFNETREGIIESIRHVRAYTHCFIDLETPHESLSDLKVLESKLFPVFTGKLPRYIRWDGTIINGLPNFENARDISDPGNLFSWAWFKKNINGKGIVVTASDNHVQDLKRLIKTLKLKGNTLPIQIVHKDELSDESIDTLIKIARNSFKLIRTDFQNKLANVPKFDTPLLIDNPQDIWFVNVRRSIVESELDRFESFTNKWLAAVFNSFNEMILMDADTVPFINPVDFFNTTGYQEAGAYFFKDRKVADYLTPGQAQFLKDLLVTEKESKLFNIPVPSSFILDNPMFRFKYKNYMDSGMLLIKRDTHLSGLLIATILQLWRYVNYSIYGDKELFWLGQVISGNENFAFEEYDAGTIGVIQNDFQEYTETICSTQIAHFNTDKSLVWVNGGMSTCKEDTATEDYLKIKYLKDHYVSFLDLMKYYKSALVFDSGMIPTYDEKVDRFKTKINGGFYKDENLGCGGRFWCGINDLNAESGISINFSDDELKEYQLISSIWSGRS